VNAKEKARDGMLKQVKLFQQKMAPFQQARKEEIQKADLSGSKYNCSTIKGQVKSSKVVFAKQDSRAKDC
jgi:hypothetical protein